MAPEGDDSIVCVVSGGHHFGFQTGPLCCCCFASDIAGRACSRARFHFLLQLTPRGTGRLRVLRPDGGAGGEYTTINVYVYYHRSTTTTTTKLPLPPMIHIEGRTGRVDPDETENDDENGCSAARWGEKVTLGRS